MVMMEHRTSYRLIICTWLGAMVAAALVACSSSGGGPEQRGSPVSKPSSKPVTDSRLTRGDDEKTRAEIEAHARRLEAMAEASKKPDAEGGIEWVENEHLRTANPPKYAVPGAPNKAASSTEPAKTTATHAAPDHKIDERASANPAVKTIKASDAPGAPREDLSRSDLLRLLHERIRQSDDPALSKALSVAGLALADPDMQLRDSDIAHLTPTQQQLVKDFHSLLAALGRQITAGDTIDRQAVLDRVNTLVGEQPVTIRTVKLCERVRGFGVYEELKGAALLAGRDHPMVIYVEIDQFKTVKSEGPTATHQVKVSQEVVLYNESDGLAVWQLPAEQIVDESRNRRRDFYIVQPTRLPARLSVGKYTMKVRVRDLLGGTLDEASIPINVVADPALAKPQVKPRTGTGTWR